MSDKKYIVFHDNYALNARIIFFDYNEHDDTTFYKNYINDVYVHTMAFSEDINDPYIIFLSNDDIFTKMKVSFSFLEKIANENKNKYSVLINVTNSKNGKITELTVFNHYEDYNDNSFFYRYITYNGDELYDSTTDGNLNIVNTKYYSINFDKKGQVIILHKIAFKTDVCYELYTKQFNSVGVLTHENDGWYLYKDKGLTSETIGEEKLTFTKTKITNPIIEHNNYPAPKTKITIKGKVYYSCQSY